MRRLRVSAKWTKPGLRRRRQQLPSANVASDRFGRWNLEQISERAIKTQHAVACIVHDNKIRDRVEILHPLFARLFDPRKEPHIFQRYSCMAGKRLKQVPLCRIYFAR